MATLPKASLWLVRHSVRPHSLLPQNTRILAPLLSHRFEIRNSQCLSLHTNHASISKQRPLRPASQTSHLSQVRGPRYPKVPTFPRREASSHTSVDTSGPQSATTASPHARPITAEVLTWNDFLRLRKIRRRFNLAASTTLAATSFVGGLGWLSEQNLEQLGANLFGLDSLTLGALSALGFAGAGWVMGPFIGSAIWRVSYSSRVKGMAAKERDFFHRIKKHRADPTQSSVRNPAPDYYGEKITSVQGYRQWLKDQREFNRKRQLTA